MQPIKKFWSRYHLPIGRAAIALTVLASGWRLGNEIPRLLFENGGPGGYDLRLHYDALHAWFTAPTFYGEGHGRDYPPASYLMFWPLIGWLPFESARAFWAILTFASLAGFGALSARGALQASGHGRILLALIPFGAYASSAAIRVGQPSPLLLIALLVALTLIANPDRNRIGSIAAGLLLAFSLLKPTLTAVPVLLVFLLPGRLLTASACAGAYALITAIATAFRPESFLGLLREWTAVGTSWTNFAEGHANLHRLLALAGLQNWIPGVTLLVLALFTGWVILHRNAGFWTLVGAAALVGRLAVHHRLHDDGLVFLALIPLIHTASNQQESRRIAHASGILFALNWAGMLTPGSFLNESGPIRPIAESAQAMLWLVTLGFLLMLQRRQAAQT